ncbi:hypothetical protein ACJJI3_02355 [Microbulbifer sp. ZKSA004]|uniref:hypothetical protein n=1 Tax=Microbulbifer sp. ZKSA004 TaxID=3243389 RepID=UPI0040393B0D
MIKNFLCFLVFMCVSFSVSAAQKTVFEVEEYTVSAFSVEGQALITELVGTSSGFDAYGELEVQEKRLANPVSKSQSKTSIMRVDTSSSTPNPGDTRWISTHACQGGATYKISWEQMYMKTSSSSSYDWVVISYKQEYYSTDCRPPEW